MRMILAVQSLWMGLLEKKNKSALNCSLAQIITEDAESPSWDVLLGGGGDGRQKHYINQARQKEPVLFIQKGFCISKCVAPV